MMIEGNFCIIVTSLLMRVASATNFCFINFFHIIYIIYRVSFLTCTKTTTKHIL